MRPLVDVLRALSEAEVRAVVVGGVAVVLHGHPRLTADLDLVLDLTEDNVATALGVLQEQGLVPRLPVPAERFADAEMRERWRHERQLTVFSLQDPQDPRREVDLFAAAPVPFEELWRCSRVVVVADAEIRFAGLDHLIAMKREAGRPAGPCRHRGARALAEGAGTMTPSEEGVPWAADWSAVAEEQLRAWSQTSADERLRWLEDALTFAQEVGALDRDRRQRQAAADRWSEEPPSGADVQPH